jgi:Xaa-Pro aminopeptidase
VEAQPGTPFEAPPRDLLAARRAALLDSIGIGVVLLPSAEPKSIEGDYPQDSDFRQHNDFYYLTGLETPHSWLVLVVDEQGRQSATVLIPERNPAEERWTGPQPSFADAGRISGITDVRAVTELPEVLRRAVMWRQSPLPVFTSLNRHTRHDEVIGELLFESDVAVSDVAATLASLRLVKDEHEIEMLRRAIDATAAAHRAAARAAGPGMYEYELEAIIELNFRLSGAERVGFPSIIGSGPNSVILHYDKNRRQMESGDVVVMDIGAEYSYYSADVTRTIPVSGKFSGRQREIYDLVLGAQNAAIEAIRPGTTVGELTGVARTWLREAIEAIRPGTTVGELTGVARTWLRDNSNGACGQQTCDAYFVHGLSHWLGMDVHDVGDYSTRLLPGMVLTIEPGIYLPDENLGVRIEDDVLVTETGHEILSAGAPRDPDAIEALMREGG